VLPGTGVLLGRTPAEVQARQQARIEALDLAEGRKSLSNQFGRIKLDDLELDEPIPAERLPDVRLLTRRQSRPALYKALAEEGRTLRELIVAHLIGHGHHQSIGTYDDVADELALWFQTGAADGFVLSFAYGQDDVTQFTEHVIPRLQDKGIFRRDYSGRTLREHLELPLPA
jgi:alkanesulfonate monooxygenase SsuD/methylene tetrahydromethanopterin reductase-like flavin-dependent oxidoreductase (luciferase family)